MATALVALSRWGLRTMYVGNVGEDEHGHLSLCLLQGEGIDVSRTRTVPGATSQFAIILVQEESGERTILWERDARIRIRPEDLPREEIRRSRAVLLDGHDVPASIASAKTARGAGVPVVLDAEKVQEGTEELIGLCDHVVAASSFVAQLLPGAEPEEGVREIYGRYSPCTAAVTLGADGVVGFDGTEFVRVRGIEVATADTTGAGDVFHAGFLFALLEGKPFPAMLAFGNAAAALSCRKVGGRAGIPSLVEIVETLSRQSFPRDDR